MAAVSIGAFPQAIPYKTLKIRHDEYMAAFWLRCRALYAGGPKLLENLEILKQVMPTHGNESKEIYLERCKRAFYIPYAGSIIDKLVAELMTKPLHYEPEDTTSSATDGGVAGKSDDSAEEQELPPYYSDLVKNCSKIGGKKVSLEQFARDQMFTALQTRCAWALVDLPKAPPTGFPNRQEQDKAGALNAYVCAIDPECVVDWEETEDGDLEWVLVQDLIAKRANIGATRNDVTLRWRYYTKDAWAVFELSYNKIKKPTGPDDNDEAKLVDSGNHTFGAVPIRRMQLPEGLWAMGKLEAIARTHMNQRNALSWGQLKALFPVPILYAMAPVTNDPISEDMGRAQQTHGQGFLRVLAEKDRLEYFSPDTAPYKAASDDLNVLRDEMHRVLYAMAQSVDNSGAALQRSGESKAIDQAAASVILRALGMFLREHLEELLNLIATVRKDNIRLCAHGMDNFDDVTLTQMVQDAVALAAVEIPSATFQKKYKLKLCKLALGADADEDDLAVIAKELDSGGITQDSFEAQHESNMLGHEAEQAKNKALAKDPIPLPKLPVVGKSSGK